MFQTIPLIRIFDEAKAKEFYLDFLGMKIDWAHRFADDLPVYLQVSREEMVFHLTEHHGDCSPGSKVFVNTEQLDSYFNEVTSKRYRYNQPEIYRAPWGDRVFEVTDPFSNRILFNEVHATV